MWWSLYDINSCNACFVNSVHHIFKNMFSKHLTWCFVGCHIMSWNQILFFFWWEPNATKSYSFQSIIWISNCLVKWIFWKNISEFRIPKYPWLWTDFAVFDDFVSSSLYLKLSKLIQFVYFAIPMSWNKNRYVDKSRVCSNKLLVYIIQRVTNKIFAMIIQSASISHGSNL